MKRMHSKRRSMEVPLESIEVPARKPERIVPTVEKMQRLLLDDDAADTVRQVAHVLRWTLSDTVRAMARAFARERGWKVKERT